MDVDHHSSNLISKLQLCLNFELFSHFTASFVYISLLEGFRLPFLRLRKTRYRYINLDSIPSDV